MKPVITNLKKVQAEIGRLLIFDRIDDLTIESEYLPGLERERRLEGLGC